MLLAGTVHSGPGAGGHWAGGAIGGVNQALHTLKKVSCIKVLVLYTCYFCVKK